MKTACGHSRRARDGRHGRVHAEAPRLVAGGRDHRARPAAGHDDGLAAQLGPALQLDARVERVAVEVRDDPPGMLGRLRRQPPERTPRAMTARGARSAGDEQRPDAAEVQASRASRRSGRTRGRRRTGRGRRRARGPRGRPCAGSRARRTAASCARRRACPASGARRTTACCRTGRGRTTTPRRGGRRSAGRSRARAASTSDAQPRRCPRRCGRKAKPNAPPAPRDGAVDRRPAVRRSGAAAARGRPAAPETHAAAARSAWRPARTFSRLLPGAMSRRDRRRGPARWYPSERAVPGSAASEMAKQSAPSAVTARTGAQVQMRPHARSIPPCGQPPAGQGMSAANDGRRYGAVRRRPCAARLPERETTRRNEQKFVTVAGFRGLSVTRRHTATAGSPASGVPARTIASRRRRHDREGHLGVRGGALLADRQQARRRRSAARATSPSRHVRHASRASAIGSVGSMPRKATCSPAAQ